MKRTRKLTTDLSRIYVGIDNGVSGSIGVIGPQGHEAFCLTPVFKTFNYQKDTKKLNRIDCPELTDWLQEAIYDTIRNITPLALIERPMVNKRRFAASNSALRAMEATLIVLEALHIKYRFVDSREWQVPMLPEGTKGTDELKAASLSVGKELFPQFAKQFRKDADGILIAEWAKQTNL